ncbi:hypothetical protein VTK73DRAFT_445 [Phialemonium thermophilum]|uniref:SnoaL-like domain-containing protein n=1 Tax=Phialemonium thermophilum TaxID=223376 RepID=A0ABR3XFA2_9PEZI
MASYSISRSDLHANLDAFWLAVKALSPTAPASAFEKYGSFLAPDCIVYQSGMGQPPSRGREAAVKAMRALLGYWELVEYRVRSRASSAPSAAGGRRIIVHEMDNKLRILGRTVEHFGETEVVEYDDNGLIVEYRLYCDPSPIREIFASVAAEKKEEKQ